jgi:N-methylhydantoinase B
VTDIAERPSPADALDPISLEVLRSRLAAIAEDAASTILRTSVSPVITESHDFGVSLLDADGSLISGGGRVSYHWVAATHAVRATIERYGESIAEGDVFFANDPYTGGGLHPNDVFVERPIHVDGRRVAWVALSAHMMDVGGMAPGSWAPAATECFQEALRVPPVRLFREGVEITDVWDIVRNNVRIPTHLEMDLRSLVAGSYVAEQKISGLVEQMGVGAFDAGTRALQSLSERELRRRIAAIADGTYRVTGWTEWEGEFYRVPCCLTVDGDGLVFDFEGATPQVPHYINSQPFIVKSALMMNLAPLLAADLPFTEGLLAPIELRCPERTIVSARPPAPMGNGQVNVAFTAAETMMQCVRAALWATGPSADAARFVHAPSATPSWSVTSWSGTGADGAMATWSIVDGTGVGGAGAVDRDGIDLTGSRVATGSPATVTDVEVLESWFPMLVTERTVRRGVNGAGAHRSGGGCQVTFRPHGTARRVGQLLALRDWHPIAGVAGGMPGTPGVFLVHRGDGTVDQVSNMAAGVVVEAGESFEFRCAASGGFGDPLDRDPSAVTADVASGRLTTQEAAEVYGVVIDARGAPDVVATDGRRAEVRARRLREAAPAAHPRVEADLAELAGFAASGEEPLGPGIVQRGNGAFAEGSGALLAVAPAHWTDGCPVLEWPPADGAGRVVLRAYLDPSTGRTLHVEAVPAGEPRSFHVLPRRWTDAPGSSRA